MKRHLLKIISAGLSLCLLLNSCGSGGQKSNKPMGRYVEEQIHEFDETGRMCGIKLKENGDIGFFYSLYSEDGTPGHIFSGVLPKGGSNIETAKVEWLSKLTQDGNNVNDIAEGPDGAVYAIYQDAQNEPHLVKSTDGKTFNEIEIPQWKQKGKPEGESGTPGSFAVSNGSVSLVDEGEDGEISFAGSDTISPENLFVLENGDFLISYPYSGGEICRYSGADGNLLQKFAMGGRQVAVYQNTLIALNGDMSKIVEYDLESGNISHEYEYDGISWGTYLGIDKDGIFVADSNGLSRISNGGSIWERVIDGGLTSMNIPTMALWQMISDETGVYYGIFMDSGDNSKMRVMKYTYSADTPTSPDTELTIFGLKRNTTIRQAIGEFQRQNPNVRVNYRVAMEDDSSVTVEDVIKALNTELLAGKAPDLLLLDGLPVESYIEKGVLADISGLVKDLTGSEGLYANLMRAFEREGKVYGVPSRFTIPVLVGDNSAMDSLRSLTDAANQVKPFDPDTVQTFRTPDSVAGESLLSEYYDYFVNDWLSGKNIDEAKLTSFLTDLQNLYQNAKASGGENGMSGAVMISSSTADGDGEIVPMGAMDVGQGKVKTDIEQINGLATLGFIFRNIQDVENVGIRSLFGKNEYTPQCSIGVVSSGKQQELAKEFVKTLLSARVQDQNLGDGLPINEKSMQKGFDKFIKDMELEQGKDLGFMELCQNLTTPIAVDYVVKETVLALESDILKGTLTPQEAAKKIIENTEIYRSE